VHREQDAAVLDPAFIPLRFVLGYAHSDERTGQSANGSADTGAREGGHDRSGSDERPKTGDRERPDTGEPSERSTDDRSRACAGRGALGRFRPFLHREVFRAGGFREQHRDIRVQKSGRLQCIDRAFDG